MGILAIMLFSWVNWLFQKFTWAQQRFFHIKMYLHIKLYIVLNFFFTFIKMGTKIQWSEYSDFVKYLINSKKN